MNTAHATANKITIYPKADCKDCYLLHNDWDLAATIVEWFDVIEVRVHRKLTAEEHAAAMAFVGKLNGQLGCLVNYDPADWEYLTGSSVTLPKAAATDAAKAPASKVAPSKPATRAEEPRPTNQGRRLPRMVVLPSSRSEKIQDGWLRARRELTHNPNAALCPSCKGVGYFNAYAKTGRNRLAECLRCNGSGNLPLEAA